MTGPSPLRRLPPDVRRAARRALTLFALMPLSIIIAVKAAAITGDPWLNAYGIGVLLSTMAVIYVAFTHYEDPAADPGSPGRPGARPFVSCLVAVKDDVDAIEACVRSLLSGTYRHREVIVVDDGSTDGTTEVLERLAATEDLTLVVMPRNVGKKRALTEGVRRARGDLLVFTDSDCVVEPDAVERCVRAFDADPDLGAVSGHARAANADVNLLTRMQDAWYDGQFGIAKAAEAVYGTVTCVSGPLAAFRREAIVNYLPAWSRDRFAGKEFRFATDRQLTAYVLGQAWVGRDLKDANRQDPLVTDVDHPEREWRVGYVRSARVRTNVPERVTAFLRQQVRWKKSFIRNLFFTGRFQWRRGLVPALLFYTHVVWVALAPFMAARHLVWLPLQGMWFVSFLYLSGVVLKGGVWALGYRVQNRGDHRWVYRPLMSIASALVLSWLLVYATATLRRSTWARSPSTSPARRAPLAEGVTA